MGYPDAASIADGVIDSRIKCENDEVMMYHLDQAAGMLKAMQPDEWSSWITYLLESLDAYDREAFEQAVWRVEGCIAMRMAEGRW